MPSRLALSMLLLGMVETARALAADTPAVTFEVAGATYAAYTQGDAVFVVQTPIEAQLTRESSQPPPACDALGTRLGSIASEIADCQLAPNGGSCDAIRMLIAQVRSDPDTLGVSALEQRWRPTPSAATPPTAAQRAEVVQTAADRTGVDRARIQLIAAPESVGSPTHVSTLIKPSGESWASKLLGFVDFDQPGVAYSASDGAFVTNDNVLACGLLANDVRVVWEQTASASAAAQLFEPQQLWTIYQTLRGKLSDAGSSKIDQASKVGAAVGGALKDAGLVDANLDSRIDFLLDNLFAGDALTFRSALSEPEVRTLATKGAFQHSVPWIGSVSP
jgi:hypothetical protein